MHKANFDALFNQICQITGLKDVGYSEIRNGRLCPVYKTNTDSLGIHKWKNTHATHPVLIEKTAILQEIVNGKKSAVVNQVKTDARSADAFFLFGIDSILIVPVITGETVCGIFCIASIGKPHHFSEDEVRRCESLIHGSMAQIAYREGVEVAL